MRTLFIFVLFFICSSFAAKNYYKILGIDKFATERDIKKAFREKAKLYHPDKNNSPNAEQKFRDLVAVIFGMIGGNYCNLARTFLHKSVLGGWSCTRNFSARCTKVRKSIQQIGLQSGAERILL